VDTTSGAELEKAGGHLRPARVVNADEQDLRLVRGHEILSLGERHQPLADETMREHHPSFSASAALWT
jgi:hypothetical protein